MYNVNVTEREQAILEKIAREAGQLALTHFTAFKDLTVEKKGHLDLVTIADQEVEKFLNKQLLESFPHDGIFGEEGGEIKGKSDRIWVIDPIDGTFNFIRGGQDWAVSIGLYANKRPIYGVIYAPVRNLLLTGGISTPARKNGVPLSTLPQLDAAKAVIGFGIHPSIETADRLELMRFISDDLRISFRCCGASTLSLISVALGETDAYLALGDATWDVMAAIAILSSLGIAHTIDWDKVDLIEKLRFCCGNPEIVKRLNSFIEKI